MNSNTETLRAKVFELVDDDGHARAVFGLAPDGTVALTMLGIRGSARITEGIREAGALMVFDKNNKLRATMGVDQDDRSRVAVASSHDRARVVLEAEPDDSTVLMFKDGNDRNRAAIAAMRDHRSTRPRVVLYDEHEEPIWAAPE